MRELNMDGESGVAASARAGSFLTRLDTKCTPRAPHQHVRIVERRGKLFRDVILSLRWKDYLAYCSNTALQRLHFAGNAPVTINNTIPYNAVNRWQSS